MASIPAAGPLLGDLQALRVRAEVVTRPERFKRQIVADPALGSAARERF